MTLDCSTPLIIPSRFNGPATSGNGGYVAGALAARLARSTPTAPLTVGRAAGSAGDTAADPAVPWAQPAVEVTLRAPTPLDVPLQLQALGDNGLSLHAGDTLIAEARPTTLPAQVPAAPDLERARAAGALGRMTARQRLGQEDYETCFGCGIRREHDGLCIVPTEVDATAGVVAAEWIPDASLPTDEHGNLLTEIVWAALDCPAGFAWSNRLNPTPLMMTGRMSAQVHRPIRPGEPCIVIGWPMGQEGRKFHAGTALFDAQGQLAAQSVQLWLQLRS